jgi:hypothetical protein
MAYVPGTPDAKLAVMYHIGVKGMQAGAMIGAFVIAPAMWALRGRKLGRSLLFYIQREPMTSLAFFTPVTLLAGHMKLKVTSARVACSYFLTCVAQDATPESIVDRAQRITKNTGQQSCDKFAAAGMCLGGLAGSVGFPSGVGLGFGQGGSLGIAIGVVAYLVYSRTMDQRV